MKKKKREANDDIYLFFEFLISKVKVNGLIINVMVLAYFLQVEKQKINIESI
jgi:hypothetical protein